MSEEKIDWSLIPDHPEKLPTKETDFEAGFAVSASERERDEARRELERANKDNENLAGRLTACELDRDSLGAELERLKKQLMGDNEGAIIVSDMTEEIQQLKAEVERLREKFRKLGDLLGDPIGGEFQSLEKAVSDLMIEAAMKGAE